MMECLGDGCLRTRKECHWCIEVTWANSWERWIKTDSGKGFLKFTPSSYDEEVDPEDRQRKRARRSREEGITATDEQSAIYLQHLLKAVVHAVANNNGLMA